MKRFFLLLAGAVILSLNAQNIALGKKYSFTPDPNCSTTADKGDLTDLTDGKHSFTAWMWGQKTAVGWHAVKQGIEVTVDLEKDQPISGVSWSCAAGASNVKWPDSILLFSSTDGKKWYFLGDLINFAPPLPAADSGVRKMKIRTDKLKTHGRYVKFLVHAQPYCIVDEIEVSRGNDVFLKQAPGYISTLSPGKEASKFRSMALFQRIFANDASAIYDRVKNNKTVLKKLNAAIEKLNQFAPDYFDNTPMIFPVNKQHEELLAQNAAALQKSFGKSPFVWYKDPQENLSMTEIPAGKGVEKLQVRMMRRDPRSTAFIICNPTGKSITFKIRKNVPAGLEVQVSEVLYTGTASGKVLASALRPAQETTVPAGCNRQIWLEFSSDKEGKYQGDIALEYSGNSLKVPFGVETSYLQLPELPLLYTGGFERSDGDGYFLQSRAAIPHNMKMYRRLYTNTPFTWRRAMPQNPEFDKEGKLINAGKLDWSVFDEYVKRWHGAEQYIFTIDFHYRFFGEAIKLPNSPRFERMVAEYYREMAANFTRKTGLPANRMYLQIFDEPTTKRHVEINLAFGRALKKANLGIKLWMNSVYPSPSALAAEVFSQTDVLCLLTDKITGKYHNFHKNYSKFNKELWLYSCNGPAKELDPDFYFRAQPILAFAIGAKGSMFHAYGCGGGICNSFMPQKQTRQEYGPYFVTPDSAMESKQSMAIRQGIQDHAYFVMLSRVPNRKDMAIAAAAYVAKNLGPQKQHWGTPKKRSIFESTRHDVLTALERNIKRK